MMSDTNTGYRCKSAVSAVLALIWTLVFRWVTTLRRWRDRAVARVAARRQGPSGRLGWPLPLAAATGRLPIAGVAGSPGLGSQGRERVTRRLVAAGRVLSPVTVALIGLVAMTGLAAAQSGSGGVCGTPVVDLFEWSTRTGTGLLLLGGVVYGGYNHARAAMTPNPERASRFRRNGTIAVFSGPIFAIVIIFGLQAAGAAGVSVAGCANLIPQF